MPYAEEDVAKVLNEMFGPGDWLHAKEPAYRGVRLKISPTGHLTLAHPRAAGPHIIQIQMVPETVPAADVLRRMATVCVLRRDKTLHYSEIKTGAILR